MPSLGNNRTKLVLGRKTKFEWSYFYLILVRFWSDLGPILVRFWSDFGLIWSELIIGSTGLVGNSNPHLVFMWSK